MGSTVSAPQPSNSFMSAPWLSAPCPEPSPSLDACDTESLLLDVLDALSHGEHYAAIHRFVTQYSHLFPVDEDAEQPLCCTEIHLQYVNLFEKCLAAAAGEAGLDEAAFAQRVADALAAEEAHIAPSRFAERVGETLAAEAAQAILAHVHAAEDYGAFAALCRCRHRQLRESGQGRGAPTKQEQEELRAHLWGLKLRGEYEENLSADLATVQVVDPIAIEREDSATAPACSTPSKPQLLHSDGAQHQYDACMQIDTLLETASLAGSLRSQSEWLPVQHFSPTKPRTSKKLAPILSLPQSRVTGHTKADADCVNTDIAASADEAHEAHEAHEADVAIEADEADEVREADEADVAVEADEADEADEVREADEADEADVAVEAGAAGEAGEAGETDGCVSDAHKDDDKMAPESSASSSAASTYECRQDMLSHSLEVDGPVEDAGSALMTPIWDLDGELSSQRSQGHRSSLAPPIYTGKGFDVRSLRAHHQQTASKMAIHDPNPPRISELPDTPSMDGGRRLRRPWAGDGAWREIREPGADSCSGPLSPDGFRSAFEDEREALSRRKLHARRAMLDAEQAAAPTIATIRFKPQPHFPAERQAPCHTGGGAAVGEETADEVALCGSEEHERRLRDAQDEELLHELLSLAR